MPVAIDNLNWLIHLSSSANMVLLRTAEHFPRLALLIPLPLSCITN
jgi:hypothetical protein